MEEEKFDQNNPQNITKNTGSAEWNFSGIGNLKLNDLADVAHTESVISQLNQSQSNAPVQEDVRLDKFTFIAPTQEPQVIEKVHLWESGVIGGQRSRYHNHYRRLFLLSFFVIVVSGFASVVLRLYSRYVYFSSQPIVDETYQPYIEKYKQGQQLLDKTLWLSKYNVYKDLPFLKENVDMIIQDKQLSYVQKKDIIQKWLSEFIQLFIVSTQQRNSIKENISKYGFFSQDLFYLLEDQTYAISIKKYLLSLEVIKFSTAIKVFGYLDTFVSSLANTLKMSVVDVQERMETFANRGEKDILVYLNNCYLNPYEIDYDCNMIGDFDRYYQLIDVQQKNIDTNFFKKMIYYVDNKLEQTDIPSFAITFKKYDPTQKQIHFAVEVNTFKQDEVALIKRWIINPHIFILTNVLHLIKQSVFVVSEHIDAKSIKIDQKVIKIGSSVFNVNNSKLDFVLPIQKWSQREITDYVDPIFIYSP